MRAPRPPRRPCTQCGDECRTASGRCYPCQRNGTAPKPLRGGRWVTVRGIRRWKTWTDEECAARTRRALQLLPPATEDQLAARRRTQLAAATREDVA